MKFLLDANFSWALVKKLQIRYPETIHVNQTGLQSPAEDTAICEFTKRLNFVILTFDEEFLNFSLKLLQPPKVVLIRSQNQSSYTVMNLLSFHQMEIDAFYDSPDESVLQIIPSKKL